MAKTRLADFIRSNQREIVDEWARLIVERFGQEGMSGPLLVNDVPEFLEGLARGMELPQGDQNGDESAREHGRQRLQLGINIDQLVQEFSAVGEVLVNLARQAGLELDHQEASVLFRLTGAAAGASAREYAKLRDDQIEQQAADHFSFMAHEIRAPLHTAQLAASLLDADVGDKAESQRRLTRAHARLGDLVDNAILSARLFGQPRLQLKELELHSLASEVMDELRPQAESRGLTLHSALTQVSLRADRKLVYSALINLLGNAVKFTRPKGQITFRLALTKGSAKFEVEDECGGMPKELPSQLFQPFVQGSKDRTGFGLGLMIVRQAAAAHGGSVRVRNFPDRGCCFTLNLPLVIGEQAST